MRLVNPLTVQNLGQISCIVYTRPNGILVTFRLFQYVIRDTGYMGRHPNFFLTSVCLH